MNYFKKLLPFLLPLLILTSCEKENMGDCFKSRGKTVKEVRKPGHFKVIQLWSHINLVLTEDTTDKIIIEAGTNLIPLIKTKMEGDTLMIRDDNTCNWVRTYKKEIKVHIHVKDLHKIDYRGTADISATNTLHPKYFFFEQWSGTGSVDLKVQSDTINIKLHTGEGDITLQGKSDMTYLYNNGNGFMHLRELKSKQIWAENSGTGNIYIHPQQKLWAMIDYLGCIYYKGNPQIPFKSITGKGELKPL